MFAEQSLKQEIVNMRNKAKIIVVIMIARIKSRCNADYLKQNCMIIRKRISAYTIRITKVSPSIASGVGEKIP